MKIFKLFFFIIFLIPFGCKEKVEIKTSTLEKYWSTLDSSGFSVYLGKAIQKSRVFKNFINADLETEEVASEIGIDAADDPAFWYNSENPEKSLVLGTNKKGGVHVFDMSGKALQFVQTGCINNIDVRDGFNYMGESVALVAATNCTLNTIALFYIDKNTNLLSDTIINIKTNMEMVYGICMYQSKITNKFYVFLNGELGDVEQWEISSKEDKIISKLVRSFKVSSRPEGMVADDEEGMLYIGVEEEGILKVRAEPEYKFETLWIKGSNPDDRTFISSDIEGIALYKSNNKTYLIASSQGNFSFAIFEIATPDKYITNFVINDGDIDGVEETDGIEIINAPINERFPKGMLVLQDGYNFTGDSLQRQNFKYVSLEKIEKLILKR